MSVVVGIKKDGVVYLGADSQATRGGSKIILTNPNNFKVWKVSGVDNCLIGHVGDFKDACAVRVIENLVREIDVFHECVDYRYVVTRIVPYIIDQLKSYNYLERDGKFKGMDSSFLFAFKDKLFYIGYMGEVVEVDDFITIGSGEDEAYGSLLSTLDDEDQNKRIIQAIKSSSKRDIRVAYPIVLANTFDTTYQIIKE